MQLIVDTNILFTYFWKKSLTRRILIGKEIIFFSPEFSLEEINKYKTDIIKKTKISESEFKELRHNLALYVKFVPIEDYSEFLKAALKITPDPKDIDFIALAMKTKLPIWSNDSLLKNQSNVLVLSTEELLNKPEFFEAAFMGGK